MTKKKKRERDKIVKERVGEKAWKERIHIFFSCHILFPYYL
jgi:hypothetical protein